jgi:hypothetical protein
MVTGSATLTQRIKPVVPLQIQHGQGDIGGPLDLETQFFAQMAHGGVVGQNFAPQSIDLFVAGNGNQPLQKFRA